jgi:hypothetical protein
MAQQGLKNSLSLFETCPCSGTIRREEKPEQPQI